MRNIFFFLLNDTRSAAVLVDLHLLSARLRSLLASRISSEYQGTWGPTVTDLVLRGAY